MTKETEAQNIENELTFSPEYEKIKKKSKRNQCMDNSIGNLKDHQ